jgi:hypothetical protein
VSISFVVPGLDPAFEGAGMLLLGGGVTVVVLFDGGGTLMIVGGALGADGAGVEVGTGIGTGTISVCGEVGAGTTG